MTNIRKQEKQRQDNKQTDRFKKKTNKQTKKKQ